MCDQEEKKQYILPNNQIIADLDCKTAFSSLNEEQKLYAHFFHKVCMDQKCISELLKVISYPTISISGILEWWSSSICSIKSRISAHFLTPSPNISR
jgi:hypothetical protein